MNILNVIKQVGELQGKMQAAQAELDQLEFMGEAGAGLVKVTLSGKSDLRRLEIDPSLMKPGEVEILEDLITAAFKDARTKSGAAAQEKMSAVTAGLPLPPGLKLF
jgi:nucleoid-associated protein EbfC